MLQGKTALWAMDGASGNWTAVVRLGRSFSGSVAQRPLSPFGLVSVFSNLSEKPQKRKASSAARAVLVLRGMWVENIADERHALSIVNPMTSFKVVWSVRAEVHLTKTAENNRRVVNQKLRILADPPLNDPVLLDRHRNPNTAQHPGPPTRRSRLDRCSRSLAVYQTSCLRHRERVAGMQDRRSTPAF
jgi:hypothetical protein